jgi:WD40 repeat protein
MLIVKSLLFLSLFFSTLLASSQPLYCVSRAADNKRILKYWHLSDGDCLNSFEVGGDMYAVVVSPDGEYVLVGAWINLYYYRLSDGKLIRTFSGHNDAITSVDISTDGQYALSGSGAYVKYWRIFDGICLMTFNLLNRPVKSVSISREGQYALGAGWDIFCYLRLSDGAILKTYEYPSSKDLRAIHFSPNGKFALAGESPYVDSEASLDYWCLTDSTYRSFGEATIANSIDISTDGQYALTAAPNSFSLWRITDGSRIKHFTNGWMPIALSKTGNYALATVKVDSFAYWRLSDATRLRTFQGSGPYAFSPIEETGFESKEESGSLPKASLSASPNPFTSHLFLSLPSPASIYSLTGQLIVSLPEGKQEIDTSSWKAGVYLIKAGNETKRIVKID